jgi:DNA-binding CsgD family transcriptional regulator
VVVSGLDEGRLAARPQRSDGPRRGNRRADLGQRVRTVDRINQRLRADRIRTELRGAVVAPPSEPTARELEVLVAVINEGSIKAGAVAAGISTQTAKNHLGELYHRIGARSREHAIWLLWHRIEAQLPTFGRPRERRLGYERRRPEREH